MDRIFRSQMSSFVHSMRRVESFMPLRVCQLGDAWFRIRKSPQFAAGRSAKPSTLFHHFQLQSWPKFGNCAASFSTTLVKRDSLIGVWGPFCFLQTPATVAAIVPWCWENKTSFEGTS
jgi:hypothetical protein